MAAAAVLLVGAGGVAGAGGAAVVLTAQQAGGGGTVASAPVEGKGAATQPVSKIAAAVTPSVVSISVATSQGEAGGTGMVITSAGAILTNNHVVAGAANGGAKIQVKFADGKTASATVVGTDPATDLAVIKVSGVSGLKPVVFGDSGALHVGDTVVAIGNPLGLSGSVSSGIVSALHRAVNLGQEEQPDGGGQQGPGQQGPGQQDPNQRTPNGQSGTGTTSMVADAIQTDAAINPGNSGGPLVDVNGRVIGVNTAIATDESGKAPANGLGFAIPSAEAKSVANQLLAGQQPKHASLGIGIKDSPTGNGVQVASVEPGGAAAAAGMRAGDMITAINGAEVASSDDLMAAVRRQQPGAKVTITVDRGGQPVTVSATLGSMT